MSMEMDQLTAHLDRGWDLAQRGDTTGAQTSAQRAIELAPESPEAHNLLGYVAALDGAVDEALEAYEQAVVLDDTYVEAMLNAAEIYLHPLGDYDEVLHLCDQVLAVTDYADEVIDVRLLQFEAFIGRGEVDAAKKTLAGLPRGPYENTAQRFLVGRAHFEAGEFDSAADHLLGAIELEPHNSDALYYFGLVLEEQGDRRGAVEAFLRSRELELAMGLPVWAPTGEALRMVTEQALAALKSELRQHIAGADIFISSVPGAEVVVDGVDPRSLVLVDVAPPADEPEQRAEGEVRVFVYALNLVKAAGALPALQQQVRTALEQEIQAVFDDQPPPSEPGD